jgi:threonine aldolase
MQIYSFKNDYSEGAHERILQALAETNLVQTDGYGEDIYCQKAQELIKEKLQNSEVDIHFIAGGTLANIVIISSLLKPYESIISAETGHIHVHETGATEAIGHKIHTVSSEDGKLKVADIQQILDLHTDEHMVRPKAVYISNSTEIGSIYSKKELTDLSQFCTLNELYLFLDGARLGAALTSKHSDITLDEISRLVDIFYIGGTKNGALFGEAIVITHPKLKDQFRYYLKQKGALLAKGRVLGIQFLELFKDDLFLQLAQHANQMAELLAQGIQNQQYSFLSIPQTNQIFPILPNHLIEQLQLKYGFYIWKKIDKGHSAIRLVTSWATKEKDIEGFILELKQA